MIPKVTMYEPADKRPSAKWNCYTYPGSSKTDRVIGWAFVLFGRCVSIQWRRP